MHRVLLCTLLVLGAATTARSAPLPPAPARWVDDPGVFLTPATRSALDARLERYEQTTGHQVVVWIGTTLDGAPLDDWAVRTFAAWKVGRAGFDDGLVVFILAADRAIDIEVGYGLEASVPDAIAGRIIRDVMAPRLRAGDRDGSVTAGVDALLAAADSSASAVATSAPTTAPPTHHSLLTWVLGGLAALAFLALVITHPRMALLLLWTFARGIGGGGGGGGGFGGGGGRSGGGGARGRW